MATSPSDIQKLREETGAGVMDCKRALEASSGDYKKAFAFIQEQGLAKAAKKGERETGANHIETYIHAGRVGVLLQVAAETDFVTRSEAFREMTKNLALHIAAVNPSTVEELVAQPFVKDESMTVENYVKSVIGKLGENIKVVRFARYEV